MRVQGKEETDLKKNGQKAVKANTKNKKREKLTYILTSILGVVVILLSVGYGIFHHYYNKLNTDGFSDDPNAYDLSDTDLSLSGSDLSALDQTLGQDLGGDLEFDEKNVTNIILLATDSRSRGNRRSRTDGMILVSINRKTKKIVMSSFMRDMYVAIPNKEDNHNRLNSAFAFGGPDLLFKTFDVNFGIKISKYAHIDFFNFIDLVDAVGGVDIEVNEGELGVMNNYYMPQINDLLDEPRSTDIIPGKGGWLHLNGKQALAYTRVRYVGKGDFERTERQRKVLTQIIQKAKKMSPSQLNKMADVVLPMISTNLSQSEVMSLIVNAPEYLTYDLESIRIPIEGSYTYTKAGDASVLGVNFKTNRQYWYDTVYSEDD